MDDTKESRKEVLAERKRASRAKRRERGLVEALVALPKADIDYLDQLKTIAGKRSRAEVIELLIGHARQHEEQVVQNGSRSLAS